MTVERRIEMPLWRTVEVARLPLFARALRRQEPSRPRGWRRVFYRAVRSAYRTIHVRAKVAAGAGIRVYFPDGTRVAAVDGSNTAYLTFAQHERRGRYEPEITAMLQLLAPKTGGYFDIGLNWGCHAFALLALGTFRGRVEGFEADPDLARATAATATALGLSRRMSVHPFGLSSIDGVRGFRRSAHSALGRIDGDGGPHRLDVAVRRLDSCRLGPPDLIKIDVEGHEDEVLAGAEATIRQAAPVILFESGWGDGDPARILAPLDRLAGWGYGLYVLSWEFLTAETGAVGLTPLAPTRSRLNHPGDRNLLAWPLSRLAELDTLGPDALP